MFNNLTMSRAVKSQSLYSLSMYKGREYEISLYIPRNAIVNNDWSLVENQRMFSIIKPNAETITDEKIWFEGLQKDSPYFNHKEVETIKKKFKVLN